MHYSILTVGYQTSCIINLTLFLYFSGHDSVMLTSLLNNTTLSAITWKYSFRLKRTLINFPVWLRPTTPTWWRSLQTSASPLLVWTACWGHWPREIPVSLCPHTGSEWILYLSGVSDHTIYLLLQILSALGDIKYLEPLIVPMNCYLVPAGSRTFCMKTWGCDGQVS